MTLRWLGPLALAASACTDRPLGTTDGTGGAETGVSSTTGDSLTTAGSPTTGPTAGTTSDSSTTSSSSGGGSSGEPPGTTIGTGPPSACGPPCAETWEFDGDLNLLGSPGDYSCLTRVRGYLIVEAGADPGDIATLANLTRVDQGLTIKGLDHLTDLSTFACLREVHELSLLYMPQLADLSALSGLKVAPWVTFDGLAITALPAFAPDFAGIEYLSVMGNPLLTDLGAASVWGPLRSGVSVFIDSNDSLTDLAGLAGLVAAKGDANFDLLLSNLPALTSLTGLESLTSSWYLSFRSLPALTDLAPLAQLETARGLELLDLPGVTDLTGLGALVQVENGLRIGLCSDTGMSGITSLAGLDSLQEVGELTLANNASLASLAGAPLLTKVGTLDVIDNPQLTQVAYDALLAQLAAPPIVDCFSGQEVCECLDGGD